LPPPDGNTVELSRDFAPLPGNNVEGGLLFMINLVLFLTLCFVSGTLAYREHMKWEEEAVTLGKCYLLVVPAAEFTAC
jgi:hypothetical protein